MASKGHILYSQAMELVRYYHKNMGETPLECLRRFQSANPEYLGLTATYAGRLDPAAEGEMLFLFGSMVYEKDAYLSHAKTYEAIFALGVSTDTGDLLGVPEQIQNSVAMPDEEKMKELLKVIKELKLQTYPSYSSKPVDGKPLFVHAREGNKVERPTRNIEIFSCELSETKIITNKELLKRVEKVCRAVKGDFRQEEILASWQERVGKQDEPNLSSEVPLIALRLHVSSGTYIRALTETLQAVLGLPAVLFSLTRISFGSEMPNSLRSTFGEKI